MAIQKILVIDANGDVAEYTPVETSAGSADGGKFGVLNTATGRFDISMMPAELEVETLDLPCSENVSAGDYLNVWNDTGTLKFRKADASAIGKKADFYTLESKTTGQTVRGHKGGLNNQVTGKTAGDEQFLSDSTPGGTVTKANIPTTTNHIRQYLGKATATDVIYSQIEEPIVRG